MAAALFLLHSTSLLTAPPAVPRATAQRRCDMPMAMAREVQPLNVVEDLTAALTSAADNQIVCIMFKMPNCRMCRAIEPKFARLASKQDQHRFYSVDWLSAKEVLKHCAIGHVPSAQCYRSGEMVHAQVLSTSNFPEFEEALRRLETTLAAGSEEEEGAAVMSSEAAAKAAWLAKTKPAWGPPAGAVGSVASTSVAAAPSSGHR